MEKEILEATGSYSEDQTEPLITVRAPRSLGWEFVLMVFTFTLYLPFWAIGRAKDMKAASNHSYQPWLWLFTPWFWIAGVFAFSGMFKDLASMESKKVAENWEYWGGVWLAAFAILNIFFSIEARFSINIVAYLIAYFLFVGLFVLLHHRFNRWKKSDDRLVFRGKPNGYTWYEWVLVVICGGFFCFFVYDWAETEWRILKAGQLTNGEHIVLQDKGFEFTVSGNKWSPVESDDAAYELIGQGEETVVYIYTYDDSYSVDDLASSRFETVQDSYKKVRCDESKGFESRRAGVRSKMTCTAKYWGDKVNLVSIVIASDDIVAEFVGISAESSASQTKENFKQITKMANSFHLLSSLDHEATAGDIND